MCNNKKIEQNKMLQHMENVIMMINNAGNVFQLCISTKRKQKLHNLERSKWALVQINMRVTLIKTGPGKEVAFTILINLKDNCVYITRSIIAHFSRRPRRLHFNGVAVYNRFK